MFVSYLRTFARLGLKAIPMEAETGPIGGDLSHEFVILADTGETEVFCHHDLLDYDVLAERVDYDGDLSPIVDFWTKFYARTGDKHEAEVFASEVPEEKRVQRRGIEVGHIFYFGDKYAEPLGATVTRPDGSQTALHSGSYGIGVSRLVGGIIEASHDDDGIIWPEPVAPFKVGLINLKVGNDGCDTLCEELYGTLSGAGVEVLYNDREDSPGAKFAEMDLIGLPWQLIVGPRGLKSGVVELKSRASGEREELSPESALARLTG
jgi:prolyl-tRNA synthetase